MLPDALLVSEGAPVLPGAGVDHLFRRRAARLDGPAPGTAAHREADGEDVADE
jgi:hypothetical protein